MQFQFVIVTTVAEVHTQDAVDALFTHCNAEIKATCLEFNHSAKGISAALVAVASLASLTRDQAQGLVNNIVNKFFSTKRGSDSSCPAVAAIVLPKT